MPVPTTTHEYIAELKLRYQLTTDYQVAKRLGISTSLMASYRTGRSRFNDAMALRVAELLGRDYGEVLANIHAERAGSGEVQAAWRRLAQRFGQTATVIMSAAAAFLAAAFSSGDTGLVAFTVLGAPAQSLYVLRAIRAALETSDEPTDESVLA